MYDSLFRVHGAKMEICIKFLMCWRSHQYNPCLLAKGEKAENTRQ